MNRRNFLACLAAGGVVTATGMWMPGQKLISIPKRVVGNRLLTIDQIINEALKMLGPNLFHGPSIQSLLDNSV